MIPLIISFAVVWALKFQFESKLLIDILKTISLFLVVAFFTNAGIWGCKNAEEKGNLSEDKRNKKVTYSIIFGIFSLTIYLLAFILDQNVEEGKFILSCVFLIILSCIFVFIAMKHSYANPKEGLESLGEIKGASQREDENEVVELSKEMKKLVKK